MKNLLLTWVLLYVSALSAQDNYFTMYSFVVEPQDQATVYNLVNDYYSKHKPEGVYVRLFENHFADAGNKATHSIVFLGTQDAVGNMYSGESNESFQLFLTQLNQHIKESSASAMGSHLAVFGDTGNGVTYPAQTYIVLQVDDAKIFDAAYKKFHANYNPPGMIFVMGDFSAGVSPNGENRWAILGYKDFKTAIGGPYKLLSGDALSGRQKAWDEFMATNGGARIVRSGLRILLGAW